MKLPAPANSADFALLTSPDGEFWLAYELARDFLSAPRHYAVLAGSLGGQGELVCLQPPQGIADEEFIYQEGERFIISLANSRQELKLAARDISLLVTLPHPEGPQAALLA
ncbi:MAG TPA: hypothetical protein PKD17_15300, partial [Cellvibrionaceae bacterium]|nr:hypothetical protein [Cellvibrionaceae bacterium]